MASMVLTALGSLILDVAGIVQLQDPTKEIIFFCIGKGWDCAQ